MRLAGDLLHKLAGVRREFGAAAGLLYLIDRLLRRLPGRCGLQVYELMAQPIGAAPLLPARLARHITWREIGPDDAVVARMPAPPGVKAARFAAGARCLVVERQRELLGHVWFTFGDHDEDEVRCTYRLPAAVPAARAVFDFDLYLLPEQRMGIGFVALWHAAFSWLRAQGVACSYSRMTRFNVASRRAHLRLGSRIVGRAGFVCLGRTELMLSTLAPFVAVTRRGRVALRLRPPSAAPASAP